MFLLVKSAESPIGSCLFGWCLGISHIHRFHSIDWIGKSQKWIGLTKIPKKDFPMDFPMNQSMAPRISGLRPSGGSLCGHRLLGLSDHWAARRLGRGRPVALHRAERGGAAERTPWSSPLATWLKLLTMGCLVSYIGFIGYEWIPHEIHKQMDFMGYWWGFNGIFAIGDLVNLGNEWNMSSFWWDSPFDTLNMW